MTDAAGNTGVFEVEVTVNPKGDTELVEDEVIYDILADQPDIDSGSSGFATVAYDDETGEARIEITDVGSWASYAKMKLLLGDLVYEDIYMVKITVKADEARRLRFTVGQGLWADPWFDKFTVEPGDGSRLTRARS